MDAASVEVHFSDGTIWMTELRKISQTWQR